MASYKKLGSTRNFFNKKNNILPNMILKGMKLNMEYIFYQDYVADVLKTK